MGNPDFYCGSANCNEHPYHPVAIPASFAVGKFEVTRSEWEACVAEGACNSYRQEGTDSSSSALANRPVDSVSWFDAKSYAEWLSKRTGKPYRLPTEAEWEYAARAGSPDHYHFGMDYIPGRENIAAAGPADAGSFPPNGFGLHDMLGNVREWVEDCYHDSYRGAPSDGSARIGGGECKFRVLRGGGWNVHLLDSRSASRLGVPPGNRTLLAGFRVARAVDPTLQAGLLARHSESGG